MNNAQYCPETWELEIKELNDHRLMSVVMIYGITPQTDEGSL